MKHMLITLEELLVGNYLESKYKDYTIVPVLYDAKKSMDKLFMEIEKDTSENRIIASIFSWDDDTPIDLDVSTIFDMHCVYCECEYSPNTRVELIFVTTNEIEWLKNEMDDFTALQHRFEKLDIKHQYAIIDRLSNSEHTYYDMNNTLKQLIDCNIDTYDASNNYRYKEIAHNFVNLKVRVLNINELLTVPITNEYMLQKLTK